MSVDDFLSNATKRVSKKSQVKEIDIESPFCTYAKKQKCNALKLIFLNKRGFPDRTILCPGGRVFFIEFKKVGGTQSPIQKKVQKMLESYGFEYYLCDDLEEAKTILDDFLAF